MSANEVIVQAMKLERVFRTGASEVRALRGVDLTIQRGQLVAVMGRSGSGKTTLLNLLGGLDRPTSGKVILDGHDTSLLPDNELTRLRRHHLGFVFQSFALLPFLSAFENVELTLRLSGMAARRRRDRVMECLDLVGLTKRARHRPYELSGGEQQRVAIARAMAPNPALILADEPTGQLDTLTGLSIFRLFEALVASQGATVVVATHDRTVEELPYLVYRLEDGRVVSATSLEKRLEQLIAAHKANE